MIWTAWNDGLHHTSGGGYGFSVKEADRDLDFVRSWKTVTIELPVSSGYLTATANTDKDSFWNGCPRLINKQIGIWLLKMHFARWLKGQPPRFEVLPIGDGHFRVVGCLDSD